MKRFMTLMVAILAAFVLAACGGSKSDETSDAKVFDLHTAQNSLDWSGTYAGLLPCADCDGIEAELTLNEDLTFLLVKKYLGKGEDLKVVYEGDFMWEGNNVRLGGIDETTMPALFKVEENQVRHLDMDGQKIEGDLEQLYVLKKIGNPLVEDKKWQLVELNGKPVDGAPETHYVVFHSKERRLEAKANCNVLLYTYKITNELTLKVEPGISTLMACPDDIEQEFKQVLERVDNLSTDGETLSLNKARMAPLARFELVK